MLSTSAEALVDLVGDVLDLTLIESGSFDLVQEPFSLYEIDGHKFSFFGGRAFARDP